MNSNFVYFKIMISNNTVVINIIGGPGCRKSEIAAQLFSELKKTGMSVELIHNPIKKYIYTNNLSMLNNQMALFAEQQYMLDSYAGKVDCIIQDCSLLFSVVYDNTNNQLFKALVMQEYHKFKNLDFYIVRGDTQYQNNGHLNTYEEAVEIDKRMKDAYSFANAGYIEVNADTAVDDILNHISSLGKE